MTLRLDDADDRALTTRAALERRSKQELAREAIHRYLNDELRDLEDREDALAVARFELRRRIGDVRFVIHSQARVALGLDGE